MKAWWAVLPAMAGMGPAQAQLLSAIVSYPVAALLAHAEGAVRYQVALDSAGYVKRCTVVESSGNAVLDRETCKQLRDTGRFKPSLDADYRRIPSVYTGVLRWTIPNK